jgi:diketogulonate reductase-like aldo/keto reductase
MQAMACTGACALPQGEDVFPIPGTKRVKYLEENAAAISIKLTTADLEELNQVFEFEEFGGRYAPALMAATFHYGKNAV